MAKKTTLSPEMIKAAWKHIPNCSEPRLEGESVVYESRDSMGVSTKSAQKFESFVAEQVELRAALDARIAAGRYTLDEAALRIEAETGQDSGEIVKMMVTAVRNKTLQVHCAKSVIPYINPIVRYSNIEAYWQDLNRWIAANLPHLDWKFPEPPSPQTEMAERDKKEIKWTPAEREELRKKHAELVKSGERAPTRVLASEYGVSETYIKKMKASAKVQKTNIVGLPTKTHRIR